MAFSSSSVLWNVPRRIMRPVIRAKNRSTWFARAAGRREMEMEPLPLSRLKPSLHLGAFVGAVVVHDEMHFLIGRELRFQMIEEAYELPAAVAILTGANDLAVEDIERGKQGRGAMALVVVSLTFGQAGS